MTNKTTTNSYDDICQNIETIRTRATNGDADAQNKIGICYFKRIAGYPQDYSQAIEWFAKSAEQGFAKAQSNLAYRYLYGEGVEQNSFKAVELFLKSAQQGNVIAACQLAQCYQEG